VSEYADPVSATYPSQRVAKVKKPWRTRTRLYSYDEAGRVAWDKVAASAPARTYAYDALGRLTTVTIPPTWLRWRSRKPSFPS
jgi:hypothetical protein